MSMRQASPDVYSGKHTVGGVYKEQTALFIICEAQLHRTQEQTAMLVDELLI